MKHEDCIFCFEDARAASLSHVLPHSLGGSKWACLPDGVVCSKCNQYFGTKVEALALDSFPLLPFRVILGIPTKKNQAPKMDVISGGIFGVSDPGILSIEPRSQDIADRIHAGEITRLTIPAFITEPQAICRLLLKMGLETVALSNPDNARDSKYDVVRKLARAPSRGKSWWFLLIIDQSLVFGALRSGVNQKSWEEGVALEITSIDGIDVFHLKFLGLHFLTPLQPGMEPDSNEKWEPPENYLIHVVF